MQCHIPDGTVLFDLGEIGLLFLKHGLVDSLGIIAMLNQVGYTPEINHSVLMEMAEHKKDLEQP
ncbi:hypothetical protein E2562_030821 [Oryza meyeriana var. granulata]|uniref:Uncharacterized protein n=1 Tax=Oryza meyeriana var. granulata TaxID=110450 RepID=A0A6G1D9L0_9ORYZ|nr:hypothetical protein E2562_030821 [Oryza meyeriana var. granulata]